MRGIGGWRPIGAALISAAVILGAALMVSPGVTAEQAVAPSNTQTQPATAKGVQYNTVESVAASSAPGQTVVIPPAYKRKLSHLAGTTNLKPETLRQLITVQRRVSAEHLTRHPRVFSARLALQADPNAPNPSKPSFDWSQYSFVGSVKDQQLCGDCWNFAAVGVFESMYAIRKGKENLLELSEEQVLRAVNQNPPGTCCGGWWPFDYFRDTGVVGAENLPYTSGTVECPQTPPALGTVSGRIYKAAAWDYVAGADGVPDPGAIKQALCDHGPLLAAVMVTDKFQSYKPSDYPGGVFRESGVAANTINHAIMIVGWTPDGWIVRNSWGTDWGANGYILIAYGSNNIGYGAAWLEVDPAD